MILFQEEKKMNLKLSIRFENELKLKKNKFYKLKPWSLSILFKKVFCFFYFNCSHYVCLLCSLNLFQIISNLLMSERILFVTGNIVYNFFFVSKKNHETERTLEFCFCFCCCFFSWIVMIHSINTNNFNG